MLTSWDRRLEERLGRRLPGSTMAAAAVNTRRPAQARSLRRIVLDVEAVIAEGLRELEQAIDGAMPSDEDADIPARLGSAYELARALAHARRLATGCASELRS